MTLMLRVGFSLLPPPRFCTESRRRGVTRAPRVAAVLLAVLGAIGAGQAAAQTAPTITALTTNSPASGDTYGAGETITATLSFSTTIGVSSGQVPVLRVQIGSVNRDMACTSCGTSLSTMAFSYTVQADDSDPDGISIRDGALVGGTIFRPFVGTALDRTISSTLEIVNSASHKVDGGRFASGVTGVTGVSLNTPVLGGTFERGEAIEVTLTFNAAVDVTGTPQVGLGIGSNTRQAAYVSGTGTTSLLFRYTVVTADVDSNGLSIAAGALGLNSGTIRTAGTTTNTLLTLGSHAISDSANHQVNGGTLTAAAVSGASIASRPRDRGSYGAGERIEVRVRFNRPVDVTGTPQLALTIGEETRQADYASGAGTATLSFSYEVAAEDLDEDGFSVAADALTLNGGTINDARSATAAAGLDLGTNAIRDAADHRVNFVIEDDEDAPPGPAPARPAEVTAAVDDGGGRVTLAWSHPRDPTVTGYQYRLQQGEQPPGPWLPVEDSDGDTTSVTIDLATGAARAGAQPAAALSPGEARADTDAGVEAQPAAVEWTIWVRAWSRGGPGLSARTVVSAAPAPAAPVPAVPAAWLGVQALLLLWCRRRRGRMLRPRRRVGGRGRPGEDRGAG